MRLFENTNWKTIEELSDRVVEHLGFTAHMAAVPGPEVRSRVWKMKPSVIGEMTGIFKEINMPRTMMQKYINTVWLSVYPEASVSVYYRNTQQIEKVRVVCPGKKLADRSREQVFTEAKSLVYDHAFDLVRKYAKPVKGNIALMCKRWIFNNGIHTYIIDSIDFGSEYRLEIKSRNPISDAADLPGKVKDYIIEEITDPEQLDLCNYWKQTRLE